MVSAWVNVELMGESTRLVCVQLQERDFEKKIFTKSDGDFQQLLCQNQFQRDVQKLRLPLDFSPTLFKIYKIYFMI